MVDSRVSEAMRIASHRGPYEVEFETGVPFRSLPAPSICSAVHVVLDARVGVLYQQVLAPLLEGLKVVRIEATEPAKSLERCSSYVEALVEGGLRRGDVLLAIGGGVIQD